MCVLPSVLGRQAVGSVLKILEPCLSQLHPVHFGENGLKSLELTLAEPRPPGRGHRTAVRGPVCKRLESLVILPAWHLCGGASTLGPLPAAPGGPSLSPASLQPV